MRTNRIVGLIVMCGLALGLAACDWPMPGRDPDRSGYQPFETDLLPDTVAGLQQTWSVPLPDGAGQPIARRGAIYATSGSSVTSYNQATGAPNWSHTITGTSGTPVATGPYINGRATQVFTGALGGFSNDSTAVLSPADGQDLVPPGDVHGAVAAQRDGNVALVNNRPADSSGPAPTEVRVVPTSDLTADPIWGGTVSGGTASGPDSFKPTLGTSRLFASLGGDLVAYNLNTPCTDTCSPAWSLPIGVSTEVVSSRDQATIYAGTASGRVVAVDASSGVIRWSAQLGNGEIVATPVLAETTLQVPTTDGIVVFQANGCGQSVCTGTSYVLDGQPVGVQPVVAGNLVYVGLEGGRVGAYDLLACVLAGTAVCQPAWSATVPGEISGLAVGAGHLYVGSAGALTAFGLAAPPGPPSPGPQPSVPPTTAPAPGVGAEAR